MSFFYFRFLWSFCFVSFKTQCRKDSRGLEYTATSIMMYCRTFQHVNESDVSDDDDDDDDDGEG